MIVSRKNIRIIMVFMIICVLFLFLFHHTSSHNKDLPEDKMIPTLFVHGFKGSSRSFNNMLERFEDQYRWGKKTMVFRVSHNGHIFVSGRLPSNQKHPFIQVVFENNRESIQDTTNWLKDIMEVLARRHHVNELYVVGHSMGGLVLTNYIEQTNGQLQYPEIKKLITIGSPFKGIERKSYYTNSHNTGPAVKDLKTNSSVLKNMVTNKDQFDPHIKVLSIAGVVLNPKLGDGVVSQESAFGMKEIVSANQLETRIVNDVNATHSGLHEHQKVDRLIGEFLWEIRKAKAP